MAEPIYLVVEHRTGGNGETVAIYRDHLPVRLLRKDRAMISYQLRIDKLSPEQQQYWLSKSCVELLSVYRWLRDEGTLPASNIADPPKEKPRQGRQLGDWWTQPKNPWPDQPPEPFPDPDSIGPRNTN